MNIQIAVQTDPTMIQVSVDGVAFSLPRASVTSPLLDDPKFQSMMWDGRDGQVIRESKVPGRPALDPIDGDEALAFAEPFLETFYTEGKRRMNEAKAQAEVKKAIQAENARIQADAVAKAQARAEAIDALLAAEEARKTAKGGEVPA